MPMLKVAQSHSSFNLPLAGLYQFFDEHRSGWQSFWKAMNGDIDKIVSWAKNAEIEEPEAWTNELYKFLFGNYSGNMKLYRKIAASPNFSAYLAQVLKNHIDDPKDKWWYVNQGLTHQSFVKTLEQAIYIKDVESTVHYINARARELGSKLYDEYLLAKSGHLANIKAQAGAMRRKAYEIENEICGEPENMTEGSIIRLAGSDEKFEVLKTVDGVIIVKDEADGMTFITDPWNVEVVESLDR